MYLTQCSTGYFDGGPYSRDFLRRVLFAGTLILLLLSAVTVTWAAIYGDESSPILQRIGSTGESPILERSGSSDSSLVLGDEVTPSPSSTTDSTDDPGLQLLNTALLIVIAFSILIIGLRAGMGVGTLILLITGLIGFYLIQAMLDGI